MNWRSVEHDSLTKIFLCSEQVSLGILLFGPGALGPGNSGCLPLPNSNLKLVVSACTPGTESFSADYTDQSGNLMYGVPFDWLGMQNDRIACTVAHSHDYTGTVQDFQSGLASQAFDLIKNEAVVHFGSVAAQSGGTRVATYMVVCWEVDFINFANPLAPAPGTAHAHDWKLIFDVGSIIDLGAAAPAAIALAITDHYGAQQPRDGPHIGTPTIGLRGFYNYWHPGPGPAYDNGFGPCPTSAPLPEGKKPAPVI
jgi:hypothetical protein